jgi:hypothetical protein
MVAEEVSFYLTQSEGLPAKKALAEGDLHAYQRPVQLIFGKSLVKSSITGDVFEGVVPKPIPYAPPRGYQAESRSGLSVELGSPWFYYRQFWQAHNIDHLAKLHSPEMRVSYGRACSVLLLIHNDTDQPREITLTVVLPAGWKELRGTARYPVRAHSFYPVQAEFVAQPTSSAQWQVLTWNADVDRTRVGSVSLRVFSAPQGPFFRGVAQPGG